MPGRFVLGVTLQFPRASDNLHPMSMADLMREVAALSPERQKELAAFLLHLRLQQDEAWRQEMGRRIDDKNPANWVSLEDWKKELASGEGK
jgi:hypothetical protein